MKKTTFVAAACAIVGIAIGDKIQEVRIKKEQKEIAKLTKELERELTELLEG